ncbi:hypothetical protein AB4K20DRAFT_1119711 [Rhizopus microsporus]
MYFLFRPITFLLWSFIFGIPSFIFSNSVCTFLYFQMSTFFFPSSFRAGPLFDCHLSNILPRQDFQIGNVSSGTNKNEEIPFVLVTDQL